MERDTRKEQTCLELGITLITIPYWWDGEVESLATTIYKVRPDVEIPVHWLRSPIPTKPPPKQVSSGLSIAVVVTVIVPYEPKRATDVPDHYKTKLVGWYF